jgi:hypothetical protein
MLFAGPLFGQSSSNPPPPPVDVNVNVTDDGSGFAKGMSSALGNVTGAINTLTGGLFGGLFGGPLKVQDDHEIAKTIANILVAKAQLDNIIRQYKLAVDMAKSIPNLGGGYAQNLKASWAQLNPAMACVSCGTWVQAATYGGNPGMNYGGAVSTLENTAALTQLMTPAGQAAWNARMANSVYLPDAAVRADLAAVSASRTSDTDIQQAVDQCRQDIAAYTSQVQVTQASGACGMVQAQQTTNTNVLLGRLVEDASIRKAREIDRAIEVANTEAIHAELAATAAERAAGIDEALRNLSENLVK